MANLGKQIDVTTLDFDQIKSNLIDYFKNSETGFSDWNFEGSNLNTIIDVLAYNTHYNALLAHMAVNESFIDSAQLRSSVVSSAKLLGYIPRSRSASSIKFDISVPVNPNAVSPEEHIVLNGGLTNDLVSTIRLQNETNNYNFTILEDVTLTLDDNGNYVNSEPITANEGSLVTRTYSALAYDSSATYEIVDENIDISTLRVSVIDSLPSSSVTVYQPYSSATNITDKTPIYFINENIFGKYEISFGDGVFGKKLEAGNIISLEYLVTNGAAANNCNDVISQNLIFSDPSVIGALTTNIFALTSRSSGGQEKESVSTLKTNAINSFATQNRAVTSDDYANLIKSRFGYINSVSVWGGEDNIPPAYGKVFICANKKDNNSVQSLNDNDKTQILDYLKSKKVLSIFPEIIDPNVCNITLDILVKYNPNITTQTKASITAAIANVISDYNSNRINEFNSIFRHSQFVRAVEDSSGSIINSLVRVYLSKTLTLNSNGVNNVTLNFGARCATDDGKAFVSITSDVPWLLNDIRLYFGEEPTLNKDILNIYSYYIQGGQEIKYQNVGLFDLKSGIMTLNTLYADNDISFKFVVNSFSNDVVATRDTLLQIDESLTTINVFVDEVARGGNSRYVEYKTFPKDK